MKDESQKIAFEIATAGFFALIDRRLYEDAV